MNQIWFDYRFNVLVETVIDFVEAAQLDITYTESCKHTAVVDCIPFNRALALFKQTKFCTERYFR